MKQAQVLKQRDIKAVFAQIARSAFPARSRCMFLLALYSDMRLGEPAALSVGDVVDGRGKVREQVLLKSYQTKGRHARTVLLNAQAQAEIDRYLRGSMQEADRPLLVSKLGEHFSPNSLVQAFGRLYDTCGLDAASAHSMRRTFLTNLAHKGVSIYVLAALAGHRNVSGTMVYLTANENVMRAAVELL